MDRPRPIPGPHASGPVPTHTDPTTSGAARPTPGGARLPIWSRPVLFPNAYAWYVLVCALDLMLTHTVMTHAGATEVNVVAAHAIERAGFWGLIALKGATMVVVLLICEAVGERRFESGKRLSEWAVAISSVPIVLTLLQVVFIGAMQAFYFN
ncbi:MAG: DUF5658 family protein [Phycisphaerales bacterium JB040]